VSARPENAQTPLRRLWVSGALLIAVIAVGTLFLMRATAPEPTDGDPDHDSVEPEVRMEGAILRQFDLDGELEYALTSPDIRFFREDGRAELTAPDLTLYDRDSTAWQIRAETGTLLGRSVGGSGEDEVRLRDNVRLEPIERRDRARLSTAALTLYPERKYAETDQAVIIDGEGGRTAAAGLEGDLQRGLLKLFSSAERPVQTTLLPGQFK